MSETFWLGVAGIVGALIGALVAPLLAERMRRKSVLQEWSRNQRLAVYAELLTVTARIVDETRLLASLPLSELKAPDEGLDRLAGQVRALASDATYERFGKLSKEAQQFARVLVTEVRPHQQQIQGAGHVDDTRSIQNRMRLSDMAERIADLHDKLEKQIRNEMKA
ncbi:hypothetical protein [Streptomyces gardneri]|uniref:hypothetical protein n=1 Tax=Streptomyces gardneri TaxID=66892 RepID=UPI0035DC3191